MSNVKLGGARAWLVWALAVIFVVWLFNVQTGYAILKGSISESLDLNIAQIGMIAGVYTWVFAIAQLFSGALLDKLGSRKVLLPAMIMVCLGIFVLAKANSFQMVLLSQVIIALGSCAGFVGAGYVGGMWFGMAKFGIMFGYVQVVAALSSAFGQVGFDAALRVMDWRGLMMGFAIFGIGLIAISFVFVRNPEPVAREEGLTPVKFVGSVFGSILEVLKNLQVVIAAAQGAITFGILLALGVVWAPNLVMAHGVEQTSANYASAAIWLGLAVGSLFINHWTDKVKSRKQPFIISTAVQTAAFIALLYIPQSAITAQALCFIIGLANAGHMLAFTIAGDNVPVRLIGTSASVVNGSMFIVSGVLMGWPGRLLAGTSQDLAAYQNAMFIMVVLSIISVILAFIIKESYPAQTSE